MGRVLHSKSRMSANTLRPAKQVQKKCILWSTVTLRLHSMSFPSTLWRLQVTLIQRCQAFMEKFCKSAALAGFTSIHCGRFVCTFFYSFKLIWDLLAVCKLAVVIIVPAGLTEVDERLQQTWAQWRPQRNWNCSSHQRLLQEAIAASLRKPQCYFLENNISFCFSSPSSCFLCPDTQTYWISQINLALIFQLKVN